MAQTAAEIEAQIDSEIDAKAELAAITTSSVAEWNLWKKLWVAAALSLQTLWDLFKAEILSLVNSAKYGTGEWYVAKCFEFQYGDSLTEVNGQLVYAVPDEAKQIVTRAAAVNNNGVVLKVAKSTGPLTTDERIALSEYFEDIKPFGVIHQIVSTYPDRVKSTIVIRFDGKLLRDDVEAAVEAAIEDYILNVDFNGRFNINLFRDKIEKATGVVPGGVDIQLLRIRPDAGTFSTVTFEYDSYSGNYEFAYPDDAIVDDRSTLTYLPV